jgi:PAB-dependent poly(A)-specific ribonuclease subunit 2
MLIALSSRLNDIGMPYYREILLSAWPPGLVFDVGAPPPKIDPLISTNLKRTEFGSYAHNPKLTRRNQVQDTRDQEISNDPMAAPKFLSEKAREAVSAQTEEKRIGDALDPLDTAKDVALEGVTKKDVPVMYRNVEIKYSKFGVDDFDFE